MEDHPQHCEEDEDDEEDLQVHTRDDAAHGTAGDKSTAQDQHVQADDAGQEPSTTVVSSLHHRLHVVAVLSHHFNTGRRGRRGNLLDVLQLCCSFDVGWVGLHNVIRCFSAAKLKKNK